MTNYYKLGQEFYALRFRIKEVPLPCRACHSSGEISVSIEGDTYKVKCPLCSGKRVRVDFPCMAEYTVSSVHSYPDEVIKYDLTSPRFMPYKGVTKASIDFMLSTSEISLSKSDVENKVKYLNSLRDTKEKFLGV